MTKQEKVDFVTEICDRHWLFIINNIQDGKVPEEWNGLELRQYIIDTFKGCKLGEMSIERKRDYKNTVIVNNL